MITKFPTRGWRMNDESIELSNTPLPLKINKKQRSLSSLAYENVAHRKKVHSPIDCLNSEDRLLRSPDQTLTSSETGDTFGCTVYPAVHTQQLKRFSIFPVRGGPSLLLY